MQARQWGVHGAGPGVRWATGSPGPAALHGEACGPDVQHTCSTAHGRGAGRGLFCTHPGGPHPVDAQCQHLYAHTDVGPVCVAAHAGGSVRLPGCLAQTTAHAQNTALDLKQIGRWGKHAVQCR